MGETRPPRRPGESGQGRVRVLKARTYIVQNRRGATAYYRGLPGPEAISWTHGSSIGARRVGQFTIERGRASEVATEVMRIWARSEGAFEQEIIGVYIRERDSGSEGLLAGRPPREVLDAAAYGSEALCWMANRNPSRMQRLLGRLTRPELSAYLWLLNDRHFEEAMGIIWREGAPQRIRRGRQLTEDVVSGRREGLLGNALRGASVEVARRMLSLYGARIASGQTKPADELAFDTLLYLISINYDRDSIVRILNELDEATFTAVYLRLGHAQTDDVSINQALVDFDAIMGSECARRIGELPGEVRASRPWRR